MGKTRIIIVTDGDQTAQEVIELASQKLDLRVISRSAGNPTPLSGTELLAEIDKCPTDPVVVMFDDNGSVEDGVGEQAIRVVAASQDTIVLGVLAVASHTKEVLGVKPDFSITKEGEITNLPVTKEGIAEPAEHNFLEGDTVDVINELADPVVVGIGDLGKMQGQDDFQLGAPITFKALQEILKRSGN
ncbi:stage V sporulation protein AE [Halanaerobaculum tunisiense]